MKHLFISLTHERLKLDVKAKPCIFLGYGYEEFGYRLWDPLSKKIVRSRDVGLTARLNLEVEKFDVKTTFLHGYLEEEIYMQQP